MIGLRLDEAEFFLRWLLLRKTQVYNKQGTNSRTILGWYCYAPLTEINNNTQKQQSIIQFLRTVNIKPVQFENYDSIFQSLFDIK